MVLGLLARPHSRRNQRFFGVPDGLESSKAQDSRVLSSSTDRQAADQHCLVGNNDVKETPVEVMRTIVNQNLH